jgi:hypothetical protein
MAAGKIMISRGMAGGSEAAPVRPEQEPKLRAVPSRPEPVRPELVPPEAPAARPDRPAPDCRLVNFRLEALERLSLLRDTGVLSAAEFEAEKRIVLRLPADAPELAEERITKPRGPSLLGRILGWKILLAGLIVGLGFVALTAPQEMAGLAERFSNLIG